VSDVHASVISGIITRLEADTAAGGLRDTSPDGSGYVNRIGREGDDTVMPLNQEFVVPVISVDLDVDDLIAFARTGGVVRGVVSVHTLREYGFAKQDAAVARVRARLHNYTFTPTGFGSCKLIVLTGRQVRPAWDRSMRMDVPFRTVVTRTS
jgi:hypothetical protein